MEGRVETFDLAIQLIDLFLPEPSLLNLLLHLQ